MHNPEKFNFSLGKEEKTSEDKSEDSFLEAIENELKASDRLSDMEIIEIAKEAGQEPEEESEDKPLVHYRCMEETEDVKNLLSQDEIVLRPFMYNKPGKWKKEQTTDIPLSYGRDRPVLMRIIDLAGEWKDSGILMNREGGWKEAVNFERVVLKKIKDEEVEVGNLYRQINEDIEDSEKIRQTTWIVDDQKTKRSQQKENFDDFVDDKSFWRTVGRLAKNFELTEGVEYREFFQDKYLQCFEKTLLTEDNKADSKEIKNQLREAQFQIALLVYKAQNAPEDDPNWTSVIKEKFLSHFSDEALQKAKKALNYGML